MQGDSIDFLECVALCLNINIQFIYHLRNLQIHTNILHCNFNIHRFPLPNVKEKFQNIYFLIININLFYHLLNREIYCIISVHRIPLLNVIEEIQNVVSIFPCVCVFLLVQCIDTVYPE